MHRRLTRALRGAVVWGLALVACGEARDPDEGRLVGRWRVDVAALRGETGFVHLEDEARAVVEQVEAAATYEFRADGEAVRSLGAEQTAVRWWLPGRTETGALRLRTRDTVGVEREVLVRFVGEAMHFINADVPWTLPLVPAR